MKKSGKWIYIKLLTLSTKKEELKKRITTNQYGLVYENIPHNDREYVREDTVRSVYDLQLGNPIEDFVIDQVINVKEIQKIEVEIKDRGVEQQIFKKELLNVYERKCAISRETTTQVLEACHIHPYQNRLSNLFKTASSFESTFIDSLTRG